MRMLCATGHVEYSGTLKLSVTVIVLMHPGYALLCPIFFISHKGLKILNGAASPGTELHTPNSELVRSGTKGAAGTQTS